jgi:hypothetical protein
MLPHEFEIAFVLAEQVAFEDIFCDRGIHRSNLLIESKSK